MANNPFFVDESSPWFSKEAGWPDEVPKNTEFDMRSLGEVLRDSAKKYADKNAIWFQDFTMTYKELDENVDRFATAL